MDSNQLLEYINSASNASKRSQTYFFMMVIVCILGFVNYWNTREGSWIHERLRIIESGIEYLQLVTFKTDSLGRYDEGWRLEEGRHFVEMRGIESRFG
jgi:hypothetical protein